MTDVKFQKQVYKLDCGDFYLLFTNATPCFAFFAKSEKLSTIRQVSGYTPCRELVVYCMADFIGHKKMKVEYTGRYSLVRNVPFNNQIQTNKMQLLIRAPFWCGSTTYTENQLRVDAAIKQMLKHKDELKQFEKHLLKGIKILNAMENECKWPMSKIYRIAFDEDRPQEVFAISGSSRWLTAAPMISLYTLILRSGGFFFDGSFETYEEAIELMKKKFSKELVLPRMYSAWYRATPDFTSGMSTYKYWLPLMQNHNKMFKQMSFDVNYNHRKIDKLNKKIGKDVDKVSSMSIGRDGILNLVYNSCSHINLSNRFSEIILKQVK